MKRKKSTKTNNNHKKNKKNNNNNKNHHTNKKKGDQQSEVQIIVGGGVLALPAMPHYCPVDRPIEDTRIAGNTKSLHCKRLVEPGWIDPIFVQPTARTYVVGCNYRSVMHLRKHEFKDTNGVIRKRFSTSMSLRCESFLQNGPKTRPCSC